MQLWAIQYLCFLQRYKDSNNALVPDKKSWSDPERKDGGINLFLVQCWRDHSYKERAEEVNLKFHKTLPFLNLNTISPLTFTEEEVPGADQHTGQDTHVLLIEATQLLHSHQ